MVPRIQFTQFPDLVGTREFGRQLISGLHLAALFVSFSNHRLPSGSWSGGGGFYTYTFDLDHGSAKELTLNLGGSHFASWRSRGVVGIPMSSISVEDVLRRPATWGDAATEVQRYTASGYKKTRPGNPVASLGQFIIELRDFPTIPLTKGLFKVARRADRYGMKTVPKGTPFQRIPAVLKNNLFSLKNLGSEYLNVVFGWKPLLRDLRQMYSLWSTLDKQLAQIQRDNGRGIRRGATVIDETDVSSTDTMYPYPYANVYGGVPNFPTFDGTTKYTSTTRTKVKVWYVAKYRYYIPDVGSSQWTSRTTRALFGANPTPDLLWEVTPWSWLLDWFGNVGDIASNLSPNAVDNLTQEYGYTMKNTKITSWASAHVTHGPGNSFWDHPGCDHCFTSTLTEETKLRYPGSDWSPFVPAAQPFSGFSPGQLGIIAALGLSRS